MDQLLETPHAFETASEKASRRQGQAPQKDRIAGPSKKHDSSQNKPPARRTRAPKKLGKSRPAGR